MKTATLVVLMCTIASEDSSAGKPNPPNVDFGQEGATFRDLKPETKLAWMAMVREPQSDHGRAHVLRGYAPAAPNPTFSTALDEADSIRRIWLIADVDAGTRESNHAEPSGEEEPSCVG